MANDPSQHAEHHPAPGPALLAYLQLFRLPNVFTAVADVMMGFLFVNHGFVPVGPLLCLVGCSCLLYTAGMVLNDVYDFHVDSVERPTRPLPSGRIPIGWARWLGYELLVVGVAVGWLAGFIRPDDTAIVWRSGAIATGLAVCVVLYDAALKQTVIGPLLMGACRLLNVLLGMSVAQSVADSPWSLGYTLPQTIAAGGIGVYIVGVTWFARSEAGHSSRPLLIFGTAVMISGFVLLFAFPQFGDFRGPLGDQSDLRWFLLLVLLGFTIVRRCGVAIASPSPGNVQVAVKHCIFATRS